MTGIPILGMLDGEGSKIIEESNAGISSSASDFKSLAAAAIKMSMLSSEVRKQLGQNGIEYSRKEFDRSILMSRLENFFISAINDYHEK